MNACDCDYGEPPEFCRVARPVARKSHRCGECSRVIEAGERYENICGKWEGVIDTCKTCVFCLALRDYLEGRLHCFCWTYSNLLEDAVQTVRDIRDEYPGLAMATGRLIVERKRNTLGVTGAGDS